MVFEFDETKSFSNQAKHGIDFYEAQSLWADIDAVVLTARSETEPRKLLIGKIGNRWWSAIFTERAGATRIISVRAARANEKAIYEQTENDQPES